ncbi:MAG: ATP-dependent nuclease [Bacillota bacterium]
MIAHIYIKNYRAFKKQSIVLGDHTLFIGTHQSGKTTVLEALDIFFNHRINQSYIRNQAKDIVIECFINNTRYRKVFSPPNFVFNSDKAIGNLSDINHLHYLYFKEHPNPLETTFNDIIETTINPPELDITPYLETYPYFKQNPTPHYQKTRIRHTLIPTHTITKKEQCYIQKKLLEATNLDHVILGIDRVENSLPITHNLTHLFEKSYQSIITTNRKNLVNTYPYHIQPLYKKDIKQEMDTITKTISKTYRKTFLLVEGKYDVPWFEKALRLLNKHHTYRVLPAGGFGNIRFIKKQLDKANFKTLSITDGDVHAKDSYTLKRDIIELYADLEAMNRHLNTHFKTPPINKYQLFNAARKKDDIVKQILASWALHHLSKHHAFTEEIKTILDDFEAKQA